MQGKALGILTRLLGVANNVLRDVDKLFELVRKAWARAGAGKSSLSDVWEELCSLLRLVERYAKGEYTAIGWDKLVLIAAAILYVVLPLDAIPDFIPGIGWLDDATVLAWVIAAVRDVIDDFVNWEKGHRTGCAA